MDEKPRIVAYKLIIDANIVKQGDDDDDVAPVATWKAG
jgi:hypothetical protein